MEKSIDKVKATIVLNNLKEHNFTIADYKLCEDEAKVCMQLLDEFVNPIFKTSPLERRAVACSISRDDIILELPEDMQKEHIAKQISLSIQNVIKDHLIIKKDYLRNCYVCTFEYWLKGSETD